MGFPRTGCECSEPGWCERHQCHKTPHWHKLCQTHQGYFDAWERGEGPGQQKPPLGLGDMVAAGLEKIGVTKERVSKVLGRPCKCRERQERLNRLGRKIGIG